jgi:hypothetical protein
MAGGMERLSEIYWELQSEEEPVSLEEFVAQACRGEYGPASPDEVRAFLREVEERLVHRIEQGEGGAHDQVGLDDLVDETHGWIDDLIGRYCES